MRISDRVKDRGDLDTVFSLVVEPSSVYVFGGQTERNDSIFWKRPSS